MQSNFCLAGRKAEGFLLPLFVIEDLPLPLFAVDHS